MNNESKLDLILLHGALASKHQFDSLRDVLQEYFIVHSFNFSGHGGMAVPEEGFSIELFETDVLNYMLTNAIESAHIFGYSMGGYVALSLAGKYPKKISSVFTLATKFDWNPEVSLKEAAMLNPEVIARKVPKFAEQLQQTHIPADWKIILEKTAEFMTGLGTNHLDAAFFESISGPVRLAVGDSDKMVSLTETINVHTCLSNSSLLILPQTMHPFELVDCNRLEFEFRQFFK